MPKVRFGGRVIPAAISITINNFPSIECKDADLTARFDVQLKNGLITIDCEVAQFDPNEVSEMYRRALDIVRASVDLFAFSTGQGLTTVLDTITIPDGTTNPICPRDENLPLLCTVLGKQGFDTVLRIVLADHRLMFALRDLIEAITLPHRAPVNCARAVEALRVMFAPAGAKKKKGWTELQIALQLAESYVKAITKAAEGHRHGDYEFVDGTTTTDVTKRAWVIMNRFLEYRKRGNQQLPSADFPLLT